MSLASWIGIVQVTFVLVVVWCAAREWLTHQPQVAARICVVGLALGTTLTLFTWLAVPRPLRFDAEEWNAVTAHDDVSRLATKRTIPMQAASTANDAGAGTEDSGSTTRGFEIRLSGRRILQTLRSLSIKSEEYLLLLRILGVCVSVGVVIQFCIIGLGTWQLARFNRTASDVMCPATLAQLSLLCEQVGITHPPRLRLHPLASSALVNWLDPRVIYLPPSYTTWTTGELSAALAHELIHVAGNDGWWRYVSRVCAAVLWFHPAAWLVHYQLCLAQEVNADRLASQMIPGGGYLVGLANLGLRMDSGDHCRTPNLSVSVFSNDLIRRIEMLKRNVGRNLPANYRMAQGTLAAVVLLCVTSLCWTVEADEAIRIASRVVDESTQSRRVGFQKQTLEPWQVVPAAEGFAAIRASAIREHEYLAPFLAIVDQYVSSNLLTSGLNAELLDSLREQGLRLDNMSAVQVNIDVTVSKTVVENDNAVESDGDESNDDESNDVDSSDSEALTAVHQEEHRLAVTAHQVVIDTVAPIDWRSVAVTLPIDGLAGVFKDESEEAAGKLLVQSIRDRLAMIPSDSTRVSIHSEPSCGDAVDSTLASVWKTVDGGLATFAIDYQHAMKADELNPSEAVSAGFFSMTSTSTSEATDAPLAKESSVAEAEQRELMEMIGYLGIGVDESVTANELEFRVVCTPIEGTSVDEWQSQWEQFTAAAIEVLQSDESIEEMREAINSLEFTMRILKAQPQRIGGDDASLPPSILLSGTLPLP